MAPFAQMADLIRADENRHPVSPDNPFAQCERRASSLIVAALDTMRVTREFWTEAVFHSIYGSPMLQAAVGLSSDRARRATRAYGALERAEARAEVEADMVSGGLLEAGVRALLYVMQGGGIDERQFSVLEQIRNAAPENERVSTSELKSILRRQATLLRADPSRAMAAISRMLPDDPSRCRKVATAIGRVVNARGGTKPDIVKRLHEVERMFNVEARAA